MSKAQTTLTLQTAIARYGDRAKAKLHNVAVSGEPEDQLRAPLEGLIDDLAELCGFPRHAVEAVGESAIAALKTRPDYAITLRNALVGFIEIKAPGKGADPRRFRGHDKEQWEKLQSLPNLLYTDGNQFSLFRSGQLEGTVVFLKGDIETSGSSLQAPPELLALFDNFFRWEPIPPTSAKELAKVAARLCRLLRDEVAEQLDLAKSGPHGARHGLAEVALPRGRQRAIRRRLRAGRDVRFAHGPRREIQLSTGLDQAAKKLGQTNSLIGAALRLLTDDADNQETLKTSLGTLTRVLDAVNWHTISKGNPDAWLYFYEDFLEVYDNDLRKLTGSYYTPPEVVGAMVRLVDDVLRSRFQQPSGLASAAVTVADPAVGTGTFLLGILGRIAATIEADEGAGAVPDAIEAAINGSSPSKCSLGRSPSLNFASMRNSCTSSGRSPKSPPRMFVTDTLGSPYIEQEWLPAMFAPIAESRKQASKIKLKEPITVVIGNPPYKEKAKGRGGWIEDDGSASGQAAPLAAWMPPARLGRRGARKASSQPLRLLLAMGDLEGLRPRPQGQHGHRLLHHRRGFPQRAGLSEDAGLPPPHRRRDLGHRLLPGRASARSQHAHLPGRSTARLHRARVANREVRSKDARHGSGTTPCPRAAAKRSSLLWASSPLKVMLGPIARPIGVPRSCPLPPVPGPPIRPLKTSSPTTAPASCPAEPGSLPRMPIPCAAAGRPSSRRRPNGRKHLFVPHSAMATRATSISRRVVAKGIARFHGPRSKPIAEERGECVPPPIRYGFRSFDRQWIIPDNRVINQPNPELWRAHSETQIYLTALQRTIAARRDPPLRFTGLDSRSRTITKVPWRSRFPALARSRGERAEPAAEAARLPGKEVQDGRERGRLDGVHRRRCRTPGLHGPLSG